jgi:hypothetical protein
MTRLQKTVWRETAATYQGREVQIGLAPLGSQPDGMLALKLKGRRTQFLLRVSDVFRMGALWHGNKERQAKAAARKAGIPWKRAKRDFDKENKI